MYPEVSLRSQDIPSWHPSTFQVLKTGLVCHEPKTFQPCCQKVHDVWSSFLFVRLGSISGVRVNSLIHHCKVPHQDGLGFSGTDRFALVVPVKLLIIPPPPPECPCLGDKLSVHATCLVSLEAEPDVDLDVCDFLKAGSW